MADIGISALVALCLQGGQLFIKKYREFKAFQGDLKDLMERAEAQWMALKAKIEIIASLNDSFEQKDRDFYKRATENLRTKIENLCSRIDRIPGRSGGTFSQLMSVLRPGKDGLSQLKKAVLEFTMLHEHMIPSFLLLANLKGIGIDQKIRNQPANTPISTVQKLRKAFADLEAARRVQTPEEEANATKTREYIRQVVRFNSDNNAYWNERESIQYTSVQTHISREDNSNNLFIIDSVPCDGSSTEAIGILRGVQDLALILRCIDDPMTFGILACAGITKVYQSGISTISGLEMVLKVPKELVNPRSLRSLLSPCTGAPQLYSINAKIELAKQLARAVSFIHSANFVHKNFRPETIIIFDSCRQNNQRIGTPFLVGFQKFRAVTGRTVKLGDTEWEKNIYRHPERQGESPEEDYRMDHDIYSLGVCLLEIALWKSFVLYDSDGRPSRSPESALLENQNGKDAKGILVQMAKEMVPLTLGEKYAEVTVSCLEGLDPADKSIETTFIETILDRLDEISI